MYANQARLDEQEDPYFFISYAHHDGAYAKRLGDHLDKNAIPVWFDRNLAWGSRFVVELQRRIAGSLGVIVVMSPAAEAAQWVEREILEGQRHNRNFLPILISGQRHFLLASSQYFDARDGRLPGDQEILQLRHVLGGDQTRRPPALRLPIPLVKAPATHLSPSVSMAKLRSFLTTGELELADLLTGSMLLEAAGRLEAGWLRRSDGERLPGDVLRDIDLAWSGHSAGAYGFGAQLARHGRPPAGVPDGRSGDFFLLARALGWKKDRQEPSSFYQQFAAPARRGDAFFPTLRNPQLEGHPNWHDKWIETTMAVHLRLRAWRQA
ncbi:TIR domain-containing protein [Sphaerisporangium corydalis]|uniref:TIR domain-containing protein n=1 Tax=Sphaerisporangium corydalis TaxID=1441875 RepID=A0ABV9EEF2_9ACTN|nr:TIR domain-containing protein [Sphaerisporangium corydalis]